MNNLNNSRIKINLKNIQTKYLQKYKKKSDYFQQNFEESNELSFLKTNLKIAKLSNNLYKYMRFF